MPKSFELPGFMGDTTVSDEQTPRLEVSCIDSQGTPQRQSFDMNTKEGRHFHLRFVAWALRNGVTYTGFPAK